MPELVMPKMGDGMEEGTILKWLKSEGDSIAEEDEIVEIQTEKATITVPATEAGTLTRILVKEGQTVAVGTPIAELGGGAGGGAAAAPGGNGRGAAATDREQQPGGGTPAPPDATANQEHAPGQASEQPEPAVDNAASAEGGRVKASPLARKVAAEHGIDLRGIEGTGPGGRIIEADVEEARRRAPQPAAQPSTAPAPAPAAAPTSAGGARRPMSQMRKVIARRLVESKQTIPHFYLTIDVDMRAAAKLRGEYNQAVGEERKVSFNDLVIRATALSLEKFPALASRLDGDTIVEPDQINVGVAVALDEGLVVPVLRDVPNLGLSRIGREVRRLADIARKGQLKPDDFAGGTFSISNLGMYDITQFQAIINPPQAAILAVGAIRDTPIVEGGQVVPGKQMYLTISVDHRLVDGHVGAQFMQELKRLLQNPMGLFG